MAVEVHSPEEPTNIKAKEITKEKEEEGMEDSKENAEEEEDDDDFPLNPDLEKPSPPRAGAPRIFSNPFEISDEESAPLSPEDDLSPVHVFETSEEGVFEKQDQKDEAGNNKTGTFRKSPASTPTEEEEKKVEENDDEEELQKQSPLEAGMDYEQLMAYFESLKESTA